MGHPIDDDDVASSSSSSSSMVFGDELRDALETISSSRKTGPVDQVATGDRIMLRHFRQESEALSRARMLLCVVVIIAGVMVGAATYFTVAVWDEQAFESEVAFFGREILQMTSKNSRVVLGEMALVSAEIMSHALHESVKWPLMTIPFFGLATERLRGLTGALYVAYAPYLKSPTDRRAWDSYASTLRQQDNKTAITISYNHTGPYLPISQIVSDYELSNPDIAINYDLLELPVIDQTVNSIVSGQAISISDVFSLDLLPEFVEEPNQLQQEKGNHTEPYTFLMQPLFEDFNNDAKVVGMLASLIPLRFIFRGIQNPTLKSTVVIFSESCDEKFFTYEIEGSDVYFVGAEDLHDVAFESFKVESDSIITSTILTSSSSSSSSSRISSANVCNYKIRVYPAMELHNQFLTDRRWKGTGVIVALVAGIGLIMCFYDVFAQRRQAFLMTYAMQTTEMLTNFFPSNVHERLFESVANAERTGSNSHADLNELAKSKLTKSDIRNNSGGLAEFIERRQEEDTYRDDEIVNGMYATKPIADLFPNTTIMFADIVGFTAWSSAREPSQVFMLLETIFRAFDQITKQRDVFKVETIGDCYVAVAGLPNARDDHAVVMALFAWDCFVKMGTLVQQMEVSLGPDTGDLSMRIGLHSGPVTAGVLRGEKSRFQLFGDSVNTAARIETTGRPGKIHMSQETADLLISSGHSRWVAPRRDLVTAKGKGVMRTYWLTIVAEGTKHFDSISDDDFTLDGSVADATVYSVEFSVDGEEYTTRSSESGWGNAAVGLKSSARLVEWNLKILLQLLKKVVEKREKLAREQSKQTSNMSGDLQVGLDLRFSLATVEQGQKDLEEEKDQFEKALPVVIPAKVEEQLRAFVSLIASMYRDHAFHNFEHASHVMLSITKLMSRVTSPKIQSSNENDDMEELLHSYTYGIASDPLLQFAVAFSALIHDVDHAGVPNTQLIKEDVNLARKYRMKSVAEKHSIRLSWERLMDSDFREFRTYLCPTQADLKRFRNFVVNTVMATDIADKELNEKRKERWRQCFDEWPSTPTQDDVQRKATIIIEHLIQASDVAHTMQHFEIFRKWNERLFEEMYSAYDSGRAEKDPAEGWYNGEIGFFDFYIIPLAKKLGDCGVFGVSSDEYLNFAQDNRQRWKKEGKEIVEKWLLQFNERKLEKRNTAKAAKG